MTNPRSNDSDRDDTRGDIPEIPRGDRLDSLLRAWHDENRAAAQAKRDEILRTIAREEAARRARPSVVGVLARIGFTRLAAAAAFVVATALFLSLFVGPTQPEALADSGVMQVAEGGALEATGPDGEPLGPCPLRHTDVAVEITGPFARTVVEQTYTNPYPRTIEAVYTFPLSNRAAVDRMTMTVRGVSGERIVEGEVKERSVARAIYEEARESGYVASLLEQERPNIFTQSVANIEPGATVKMRIATIELVERKDGVAQYAFPMVVGPRYIPGRSTLAGKAMPKLPEAWAVREGLVLRAPAKIETEPGAAISAARLERMVAEAIPVRATDNAAIDAMLAYADAVPFLARYANGSAERGTYSPTASIGEINGRFFFAASAAQGSPAGTGFANPTDQVPDADRVTPMPVPPATRAGHDISVTVSIDSGGVPLGAIESAQHEIRIDDASPTRRVVTLVDQRTIPNRDFMLRWDTRAGGVEPASFAHMSDARDADAKGGYFALMLEPPARVAPAEIRPRELVFVLDVSGSMNGFPIEKSKELARKAIARMRPNDTFNIITFAGATAVLWSEPKPATAENIAAADRFIAGTSGGGGTEMMSAINAALVQPGRSGIDPETLLALPADGRAATIAVPDGTMTLDGAQWKIAVGSAADGTPRFVRAEIPVFLPENPKRLAVLLDGAWSTKDGERVFVAKSARFEDANARTRFVFFLTDGYIGNDQAVVEAVHDNARASRVFSFGIGSSVNRFLLEEMARAGRGACDIVTLAADADAAVDRLVRRIDAPVLTDLELAIDPALGIRDLLPAGERLPDLFDVEPLVLLGRYDHAARGSITLRGRTGAGAWERTVAVDLPAQEARHDVVPTLWARAKVDGLLLPKLAAVENGSLDAPTRRAVIRLGEAFHITTPYTSFVAVEKSRVVVGGKPMLVSVPVELPSGTNWNGFFGEGLGAARAFAAETRGARRDDGAVSRFGLDFSRLALERGLVDEAEAGALADLPAPAAGGSDDFTRSSASVNLASATPATALPALAPPPVASAPSDPSPAMAPAKPAAPGERIRPSGGQNREILKRDSAASAVEGRRAGGSRAEQAPSGQLGGMAGKRAAHDAPIARPGATGGGFSGGLAGGVGPGGAGGGAFGRPSGDAKDNLAKEKRASEASQRSVGASKRVGDGDGGNIAGNIAGDVAGQAPEPSPVAVDAAAESGARAARATARLLEPAARDTLVRVLDRRLVVIALAAILGESARVPDLAAELDLALENGTILVAMKVATVNGTADGAVLKAVQKAVDAAGGSVGATDAARGLVVVRVSPEALSRLALEPGVLRIEPCSGAEPPQG